MRLAKVWVGLVAIGFGCTPQVTELPATVVVERPQPVQHPNSCRPCHERQFVETQQSLMSGYRSVSPAMNSLELAGNFAAQAALENGTIRNNLRPVYAVGSNAEAPEGKNVLTAERYENANEVRAGFCVGCHNPALVMEGEDPDQREIPEWSGRFEPASTECAPENPTACFQRISGVRPLRDHHFRDADGKQVLPDVPGGAPPPGTTPSLGAHAISCDICHGARGPAQLRSLGGDGYANVAFDLKPGYFKVGPFTDAVAVGPDPADPNGRAFHSISVKEGEVSYLRSSDFCNACHDVRVPARNLVVAESSPPTFRLENLGTEWATQAYARPDQNPFEQVVRCQDCHMSLFPYSEDATYSVLDPVTGQSRAITSPRPGVFPMNVAASGDDPTGAGLELPVRPVVTHYFTGVDVPLASDEELRERLSPDRPSTFQEGTDEHGMPRSLFDRRRDLIEAAVRLFLDRTDDTARLGEPFDVRVTAVALTGHNFPAGFSQERTAWIELSVSAKQSGTGEDFVLYQSGYLMDKAHPETGEMVPDGSLDDEDLEHLEAVVNPFTHHNEVFELGPDTGPLTRIFEGEAEGLVLFRNELVRIYGPEMLGGVPTGIPAGNRVHPRTGEVLSHVHEEETFSAGTANSVDNWRSLQPLVPRTFRYRVELPSAAELADLGVQLEGPITVRASVHFQHFPPLFLRFLARVAGGVPYTLPPMDLRQEGFDVSLPGYAVGEGRRGPADLDFGLMNEARIDSYLKIVRDVATAERTVILTGGGS